MCAASKRDIHKHPLKNLTQEMIHRTLVECGFQADSSASDILKLSEVYNAEEGSPEVWESKEYCSAYLNYFMPLNCFRMERVMDEALRLGFFKDLQNVWEFGSGPGTAQIAGLEALGDLVWSVDEASTSAQKIHTKFIESLSRPAPKFQNFKGTPPSNTLGLFSYSLCEDQLPGWAHECEALLILEPSTRNQGRKLMELRAQLIEEGFSIWAPCTHQGDCPLLTQSKNDWCHLRSHFEQPEWFTQLESKLPMKNKTLTYSYLLARKQKPNDEKYARVIGDTLKEKGKTRQAICRNSDREFLSWLKRYGKAPILERGSLIKLSKDIEKKGNELRVQYPNQIDLANYRSSSS